MSKLKNRSEVAQANPITEVAIFKYFPISHYLVLVLFWIVMFLVFFVGDWIKGRGKRFSILHAIIGGAIAGFVFHLPNFLSALIMNLIRKPILRFDAQGFYYTPQIWSKSKLYEWDKITGIKTKYSDDKWSGYKCTVTVYLKGRKRASLNVKIMPISYKQLLKIFRYRLKNVPIKLLK